MNEFDMMQMKLHIAAEEYGLMLHSRMVEIGITYEDVRHTCDALNSAELHPDGTRERIAALEAERDVLRERACAFETERNEARAARDLCMRVATQKQAERDNARAWANLWKRVAKEQKRIRDKTRSLFQMANNNTKRRDDTIADLRAELELTKQHFTDEYTEQQHVIGVLLALLRKGAGDDTPEYARALEVIGAVPDGDISAPLSATDSAFLCPECGVAMERTDSEVMGCHFYVCAEHGALARKERAESAAHDSAEQGNED